MTKAAYISFGLAALMLLPAAIRAQDSGAVNSAIDRAVMNQANTIVLRQKLADALAKQQQGDIVSAAKLYQESYELAQQIGPGVEAETAQAIKGVTSTALILARDAQSRGDLREADARVNQALRANPKNPDVIAFKKHNDELLQRAQGKMPSAEVLEQVPQFKKDKINAGTLVQDGKLLYEAGKLEDAEAKLNAAQKLDPDNPAIVHYLSLIQQAKYARANGRHEVDYQRAMEKVEKKWVLPTSSAQLPVPNAYATNALIHTGPGRQTIADKLSRIHLANVSFDGIPLSEVVRQLAEDSKLYDPEKKGINFIVNPNPDLSGSPVEAAGNGLRQFPNPATQTTTQIDPATGLPIANPTAGGGGSEAIDIGSAMTVKLSLTDVSMADVLNAIILVANDSSGHKHQLKYSIEDFGVVFSDKGANTPQLFTRWFKVDPNTFYSGLESVGASSYGSINNSSTGGTGGGGGGSGDQENSGGVVGVVNAFSGAGGLRNTGNGQGGGGGGGGGQGQGASNPLDMGGTGGAVGPNGTPISGGGGGGNQQNEGGIHFVTQVTLSQMVSVAARNFFTALGVNLMQPAGKAVFFNDRNGTLVVRATQDDLDTIEQALQALNQVAPQVHIKARFIEEQQKDDNAFGFNWYLGQFNIGGKVVGQGGSSSSLYTPSTAANPSGIFPGTTLANAILPSSNDQLVTAGLRNALNAPAIGTITGILTNPNFQVALQALEQRSGIENLAEPEVVTTSGRQTQMRATQVITIIAGFNFQQGTSATTTSGQ